MIEFSLIGNVVGLLWSSSIQITDTILNDSHSRLEPGNPSAMNRGRVTENIERIRVIN